MMLAVVMIALLAQSQGYIWSNYISKGYSPCSRYCRVQFGIEMEITSISTLIECFHLHREKVRGWTTRYPQDDEISSGLTNCSAMISFLEQFRDNESASLLVQVEGLRSRIQGYEEKVNSLERKLDAETNARLTLELHFKELELNFESFFEEAARAQELARLALLALELKFESFKLSTKEAARAQELAAAKKESLMMTFDLVRMFRFYYLPKSWKWRDLAKQCAQFETDITDGVKTDQDFTAFLKPYQDKVHTTVSLRDIMKQTNNRYAVAHNQITNVESQEDFLDICAKFQFQDAEVQTLANSLMIMLKIKADGSELKKLE